MNNVGLISGLLLVAVSAVDPVSAEQVQSNIPNVIVTAPKLEEVPNLIEQFGKPISGERLARWRQPVCPRVIGFTPQQDAYIASRIVQISMAAHIASADRHCDPNLFVMASSKDLEDRRRIGKHAIGKILTDGRWPVDKSQMLEFTRDDGDPVHVFYVTGAVSPFSGAPEADDIGIYAPTSSPADSSNVLSMFGAPVIRGSASRITASTDTAFIHTLVVVDGKQLKGISASQFAAYISMVTLAEVRVDQPLNGVMTVANMFSDIKAGVAPQDDLTFWDRAYLGALYRSPTKMYVGLQETEMATRIKHSIEVLQLPPANEVQGLAPTTVANH